MRVLIPSYCRCGKVTALEYARRISSDVVISVQTEEDKERYTRQYGNVARVVYRHAETAAGNRNTALSAIGDDERALMLDDDVKRLLVCNGPTARDVREATRADIERCFSAMEADGIRLGGFYPVNNPYFAFNRDAATTNDILIGAAQMFIGGGLRFDESYEACEDYALVLEIIAGGGRVMRFNRFLIDTTDDSMADALRGKTKGGMAKAYASGKHKAAIRRLVREYWPIAKLGRSRTSIQVDKRYV